MNQKQVKKLRKAVRYGKLAIMTKSKFRRLKKLYNKRPHNEREAYIKNLGKINFDKLTKAVLEAESARKAAREITQ